jgi:protein-S-isoprenylcysteine O-methyltransferase Ste14
MPEFVLKVVVVSSWLGIALLRVYGLARAHALGRRRSVQRELPALIAIRAVLGVPVYVILVGWLVDADWVRPTLIPLPVGLRWAGIAVAALGLCLMAWSHVALGANFETALGRGLGQRLVTDGPYRRVRHPMYLSFLITHLGIFLMSANWALGLGGIGMIVAVMAIRTPQEEAELADRYGDAYRRYARHTGRFFPRWRSGVD